MVLVLEDHAYRLRGEFTSGQVASGILIPALTIAVDKVLELAEMAS